MTAAQTSNAGPRERALGALYDEIWNGSRNEDSDLVPRKVVTRSLDSAVFLVAQALAAKTQRLSGLPYCYPGNPPRLSRGGNELDRFLARFGYTIDPREETRQYAYHSDIGHLFPGRKPGEGDVEPPAEVVKRGRPWLLREIELVEPAVILTLGKPATLEMLRIYGGLEKRQLNEALGQGFELSIAGRQVPTFAAHHPSGAFQHPSSGANFEWAAERVRELLLKGPAAHKRSHSHG